MAMTGEITLSGHVLPVGGIKEKVLAARRLGVYWQVALPKQNEKDVNEDLSPELKREITVHYVSTIDEVLELALLPVPGAQPRDAGESRLDRARSDGLSRPLGRVAH